MARESDYGLSCFGFFFGGGGSFVFILGGVTGGLSELLFGDIQLLFSLEVGDTDLVGGRGESLKAVHGLAQVLAGFGQIGGKLAFAHNPSGGKEGGEGDHANGDVAIPRRFRGKGGGGFHKERVWKDERFLKSLIESCLKWIGLPS